MLKVVIYMKKEEDALWALPDIAESIAKGCDGGWNDGVKWNVEKVE